MKKLFLSIVLFASALVADAQTFNTPDMFTNVSTAQVVTLGATSNLLSQPIVINPGVGIGLTVKEHSALTSSTTNFTVLLNVSYDGTNWPSPAAYTVIIPHVANTTNFWATNLPATWFDGFMRMRLESFTNQDTANSITVDQATISRKRLDY